LPCALPGAAIGNVFHELHAVLDQELERRRAIVRERTDDLLVVVAIVRRAVRLHDRPVRQVLEHEIGRVVDAGLLLERRAATERDVRTRADRVTADVAVRIDDDHR
jgi:hypothetical protein